MAIVTTGSYGGGVMMRDNSGQGNYFGGMYLASNQLFIGATGVNSTSLSTSVIIKGDGQAYFVANTTNFEGTSPTLRFWDSDNGTTSWIHMQNGDHGFLAQSNFAWACFRNSNNDWQCQNNIIAFASDRRLKTNIKDVRISRVDEFFNKLRIREYDWDERQTKRWNLPYNGVEQIGAHRAGDSRNLP
ncbi:tail fiber protein [Xanthomonas phage JGB6]|nr:tail fiber protein [Xanthomonas phage JGB6]